MDLIRAGGHGPPVILAPGTFSDRRTYEARGGGFAEHLAREGFSPWLLDYTREETTTFDTWIREDAPNAVARVAATEGRRPFWVGHSAGGTVALGWLASAPENAARLAGLVLLATQVWEAGRPISRRFALEAGWAWFQRTGGLPHRVLRIGPVPEAPGVMAQWFHWNRTGTWTAQDGYDYRAGLGGVTCPVLAFAAAGDRFLGRPAACRNLLEAVGATDRTFCVVGRANGYSDDYGHAEILVGRSAPTEVWPRICDWLRTRAGAP